MSNHLITAELESKALKEVYSYAKEFRILYYSKMDKKELSLTVIHTQAEKQRSYYMKGILDIVGQDGYGFLWPISYESSIEDIYISASQIRRFNLGNRGRVAGKARPPEEPERYYGLIHVESVNGKDPEEAKERPHFPVLTLPYPWRQLQLETIPRRLSTRVIDIFSPVGFGQRGLTAASLKVGKISVLKEVADGTIGNYLEIELIVLLIDERPEGVTGLERSVKGDVASSTSDLQPQNHAWVFELVLERAMRLVEDKRDAVVLMGSITRLARAYNLVIPPSGHILSGGIDPTALCELKKFFEAARNIEEGGSLTTLTTALVDTGNRMNNVIYEGFKGTGNLGLQLSHKSSERRTFLAVDVKKSGTRREELSIPSEGLGEVWKLRKNMTGDLLEYTEQLIRFLRKAKNNRQFFEEFQDVSFGKKDPTRDLKEQLQPRLKHVRMLIL